MCFFNHHLVIRFDRVTWFQGSDFQYHSDALPSKTAAQNYITYQQQAEDGNMVMVDNHPLELPPQTLVKVARS